MTNDPQKLYAQRDTEGSLHDHYFRHVMAMTAEKLHEKSAIAAELAWRDAEIDRLRSEVAKLGAERTVPSDAICVFKDGDQFVCALADFVNLQESPSAFGRTAIEAIEAFEKTSTDELCDKCYGTGEDEYDKGSYCPECKGFGKK